MVKMKDHQCYVKTKSIKEPCNKLIFLDFECCQETGTHIVNLDRVYKIEGGEVKKYWFKNIDDFCKWAIHKDNKNYTFIAHNGKGYDFQFILKYCVEQAMNPFTIYAGSKIMCMTIQNQLNIRFIDSFNFITMPLAKTPKTFGIKELKKRYFPHFFNTTKNKKYIGPIPEKD